MESVQELPDSETLTCGKDCEIGAGLTDLLRSAAGGDFDRGLLPAGLAGSGLAEVLTKIADTRKALDGEGQGCLSGGESGMTIRTMQRRAAPTSGGICRQGEPGTAVEPTFSDRAGNDGRIHE